MESGWCSLLTCPLLWFTGQDVELRGLVSRLSLPLMRPDLTVCSAVPALRSGGDAAKAGDLVPVCSSRLSDGDRKEISKWTFHSLHADNRLTRKRKLTRALKSCAKKTHWKGGKDKFIILNTVFVNYISKISSLNDNKKVHLVVFSGIFSCTL